MKRLYILFLLLLFIQAGYGQNNGNNNGNLTFAGSLSTSLEKAPLSNSVSVESKVTLIKSKLISRNVIFNWVSSENTDCKGYYIEKKFENSKWEIIAFINAKKEKQNYYSYSDRNLQAGEYQYRLKQVFENKKCVYLDFNQSISIENPKKNSISHNLPSVFNPFTTINFQLENSELVNISIYNEEGKLIEELVNEDKDAGYYQIKFNTRLMQPGKYFYKIKAGNYYEVNNFVAGKQ